MTDGSALFSGDDSAPAQRPAALGDWVYDNVRRFLREGNMRPGDKLRLQIIADRLGVSQTPVREAMLRLAQEDLVVPAGRGFEVPRLSVADFENLFELRRALEPRAFASVARNGDATGMAESLRQGYEAHAAQNVAAFARANTAFRRDWFSQVSNPRMVTAMRLHDDHFVHLRRLTHEDVKVRDVMLTGHSELVQSVQSHDPVAAIEAMNRNLDRAQESMLAVLARQAEK
jgi:DNA-binding GntR family transcriptional regulator